MIPTTWFTVEIHCEACNATTYHFIDFVGVDYKKKLIFTKASCEICENIRPSNPGYLLYWNILDFNYMMPKQECLQN